jgi:hypothetical protein
MEAMLSSTYVAGIPALALANHRWLAPAGDVQALTESMRACLDAPADRLARMGAALKRSTHAT